MARPELAAIWTPSVQQRVYRELLDAMSRPGTVIDLEPILAGEPTIVAALASVADDATSLADPDGTIAEADRRMLGTRDANVENADFVVADARRPAPSNFEPRVGTIASPEHSATLWLVGAAFTGGTFEVEGPGIATTSKLALDVDDSWLHRREQWCASFPLGVEMFFIAGTRVAALPRTTVVRRSV